MPDDHLVFRSLLSPANCAVILFRSDSLAGDGAGSAIDHRLAALLEAAEHHAVPTLVLASKAHGHESTRYPLCVYKALNPLVDSEVRWALAQFNRPRFIIGGEKAETSLTFAVLSALEEGYDVHLLRDLLYGASESLAETAAARMIQAGAVPISVVQVVAEWACGLAAAGSSLSLGAA